MMPGLVAFDVVLREREAVAALPGAVRAISRYAQAPLQTQLELALEEDDAALMERILSRHSEDVRMELLEDPALDAHVAQYAGVSSSTRQHVLHFGAQHGREAIVTWISGCEELNAARGLALAVSNGHLAIVKLLHKHIQSTTDHLLMNTAARHGHLDILQWLYANPRGCEGLVSSIAAEEAARFGHVDVLEWLYAIDSRGWSPFLLKLAVEQGQLGVAQWLFDHGVCVVTATAFHAALQLGSLDMLEWLHDHYYQTCRFWELEEAVYGRHAHAVQWLLRRYPDRHDGRGGELAALCGDLGDVEYFFTITKKLKRRAVRSAMCKAARRGHFPVLQWLVNYEKSKRFQIPKRAIWKAVAGGHVELLKWCVERLGDQYVQLNDLLEYAVKQHVVACRHAGIETAESLPYREFLAWLSKAQVNG